MVLSLIHSDFAIAGIDREALLITEKCVAHFVLTAGWVGLFAEYLA